MATSQQPPLTPDERLAIEQKQRYDSITRNVAIGGVVLCPLIALMPPRKLDLYTLSLGIGFYLSADHLVTSNTGRSLFENIPSFSTPDALPTEKAREMQRILKEREEIERGKQALRDGAKKEDQGSKNIWQKIWMGNETEGWKERRLEEERKALEEGKSYTSMIVDQIWDVWNWDKEGGEKRANDSKDGGKKD